MNSELSHELNSLGMSFCDSLLLPKKRADGLGQVVSAPWVCMRKTVKPLAFIFLLALIPAALFSINGFSGDDFCFHVPSWMELRDSWLSGQLWPRRLTLL